MRYLLITFLRKPGGQIDEIVKIANKIKPADIQTCNVILDYGTKTIHKCVIEGNKLDTDWERMNSYYKKVYPSLIDQLEKEAEIDLQVDK